MKLTVYTLLLSIFLFSSSLQAKDHVTIKDFTAIGTKVIIDGDNKQLDCRYFFNVENLSDTQRLFFFYYDLEGNCLSQFEVKIEREEQQFFITIDGKKFKFRGEYMRCGNTLPYNYAWKCSKVRLIAQHKNGKYSNKAESRVVIKKD